MDRNCGSRALVVGGGHRLPSDPCEYNYEASFGPGCNNLRCEACHAKVRIGQLGTRLRDQPPGLDVAGLYAAERWATAAGSGWRLYACKCQLWEELHEHFLENDHDSTSEPELTWKCAGHPVPTLPMKLGELDLRADTDWSAVVRQVLGGVCPRPLERPDEGPWLWLTWLYAYLDGLPCASSLSRAVGEHLDDRDDHSLAAALCFFRQFPTADGVERIVNRAESDLEDVLAPREAPKNEFRPTIWDLLVAMMRKRPDAHRAIDTRVTEVMRKVMLLPAREPDRIKRTLDGYSDAFRADDFAWMADNVVALETAGSGRWNKIMNLLVSVGNGAPQLAHLAVVAGIALIQSRRVSSTEIRTWIDKRGNERDAWVQPLILALDKVP